MLRQVSHEISWLAQAQLAEHGLANPSVPAQEAKRSKCDTGDIMNHNELTHASDISKHPGCAPELSRRGRKLVYGVGLNNANYSTHKKINGIAFKCRFYSVWQSMLQRCYDKKLHEKRPTYIECLVCDEWLTFSNFKSWMEVQEWQGRQLDKDIINPGNNVYSPENCAFVSSSINNFVIDNGSSRGDWPIGVNLRPDNNKFQANCRNPFTKKLENLGLFDCPKDAHFAWRKRKHYFACLLADECNDPRVSSALRSRYL